MAGSISKYGPIAQTSGITTKPSEVHEASGTNARFDSPFASLATGELTRVSFRSSSSLSPQLAALLEQPWLAPLIAACKAGRRALWPDQLDVVKKELASLDRSQVKELQDFLLNKPPHPRLRELKARPVLREEPSIFTIECILTGWLFDGDRFKAENYAFFALRSLETEGLIESSARDHWFQAIAGAGGLASLQSFAARDWFSLLQDLGVDTVVRLGAGDDYTTAYQLLRMFSACPDRIRALISWAETQGGESKLELLQTLLSLKASLGAHSGTPHNVLLLESGATPEQILRLVPLWRASRVDEMDSAVMVDRYGVKGAVDAMLACGTKDELMALFRRTLEGYEVQSTQQGVVLLRKYGPEWPPMDPPRTPTVEKAEAELLAAVGLPKDALGASRSGLSSVQVSSIIRAMRRRIAEQPELVAQLDRELDGRRFVSARYYNPAYAKGTRNPEDVFTPQNLAAWREGEAYMREQIARLGGRPLAEGEVVDIMKQIHRRVAVPLVGMYMGPLTSPDELGQLRDGSKGRTMIALFRSRDQVTPEVRDALLANPFLDPETATRFSAEVVHETTVFPTPGAEVHSRIAELDQWLREKEGKIPTEQLVAELHYRLVSIHPFLDGQGRTAKLLIDFFMARGGLVPPLWGDNKVLVQRESWHQEVSTGVLRHLATVERYFRVACEAGTSK